MSTRPPPLRAPPGNRPPTYRMVTRVYSNSLRPIVIVMASVLAIWSLIWAIPSFHDINDEKENGLPKFATFDIVLGTIYATACAIEVFGVIAATMQRLPLIRIYAMLSIFTAVAVIAAGFLRVVIHFVYKDGLLNECERVAQGEGVEFRFGIWGPKVRDRLTAAEAQTFCKNAWNKDSLNEIIFLIFEIVFAIFFTVIAFAYYHQVRDPTSAANVTRTPVPGATYPDHYNPPYDAQGYNPPYLPYNAPAPYNPSQPVPQPAYAPPPGPPPTDMGYGVEMGAGMGARDRDFKDDDSEVTKFEDPFADFDEPSKSKSHDAGTPPAY